MIPQLRNLCLKGIIKSGTPSNNKVWTGTRKLFIFYRQIPLLNDKTGKPNTVLENGGPTLTIHG